MEIRIRHECDDIAQHLGEVPFERAALDGVVPLLTRWGVTDENGNSYDNDGEMMGQFKVDSSGAYFEIVLTS